MGVLNAVKRAWEGRTQGLLGDWELIMETVGLILTDGVIIRNLRKTTKLKALMTNTLGRQC